LGNSHDNFQLHKFTISENIAKSFREATFFDSHCTLTPTSECRLMFSSLVGLPANLLNRLQSMLNAAALQSPVFTALPTSQILFAVSTGYVLPSESSSNWQSSPTELFTWLRLSNRLSHIADMSSPSWIRSSTSNQFAFRPSRLVASAGPKLWNSLPDDIRPTSASSLTVFRRKLKTHLFRQSYPDIIM